MTEGNRKGSRWFASHSGYPLLLSEDAAASALDGGSDERKPRSYVLSSVNPNQHAADNTLIQPVGQVTNNEDSVPQTCNQMCCRTQLICRETCSRFEDSQHEISTDEELLLLAGLELKTGEKIANVYSQ